MAEWSMAHAWKAWSFRLRSGAAELQITLVAGPRFEPALFSELTVQLPRPAGSQRQTQIRKDLNLFPESDLRAVKRRGVEFLCPRPARTPSRFGSGGSGWSSSQHTVRLAKTITPVHGEPLPLRSDRGRRCNRCNVARQPWQIWRLWQSNPCMFLNLKG
jgi:hypothetical protein